MCDWQQADHNMVSWQAARTSPSPSGCGVRAEACPFLTLDTHRRQRAHNSARFARHMSIGRASGAEGTVLDSVSRRRATDHMRCGDFKDRFLCTYMGGVGLATR